MNDHRRVFLEMGWGFLGVVRESGSSSWTEKKCVVNIAIAGGWGSPLRRRSRRCAQDGVNLSLTTVIVIDTDIHRRRYLRPGILRNRTRSLEPLQTPFSKRLNQQHWTRIKIIQNIPTKEPRKQVPRMDLGQYSRDAFSDRASTVHTAPGAVLPVVFGFAGRGAAAFRVQRVAEARGLTRCGQRRRLTGWWTLLT